MVPRKVYIAPTLSVLLERKDLLSSKYDGKNPERHKLINFLCELQTFFANTETTSSKAEKNKYYASLGLWTLCLEAVRKEYHLLHPERSSMYRILAEGLEVRPDNQLDDRQKLIYCEKLYNYLLSLDANNHEALDHVLKSLGVNLEGLKKQIKGCIQNLFIALSNDIVKTLRSVPTEKIINQRLSNTFVQYQQEKAKQRQGFFGRFHPINKEREFLAQFASAMGNILPIDDDDVDLNKMTRSQRIKLGIMLYIMESINRTYKFILSPNRSLLFDICRTNLSLDRLKDVTYHTKLICISAFRSFLNAESTPGVLEKYGHKHFQDQNLLTEIDPKLQLVDKELEKILDKLTGNDVVRDNWAATKTLAQLGALILSAPGYGMGYALGYSVSETHSTVKPKIAVSNVLNYACTAFLGFSKNFLGTYFAADFIVQSTVSRGFAVLLQELGIFFGYVAGGTIGLMFDLSYRGFRNLCLSYLHVYENINDPELIKNANPEFVRSLLNLPEEIFTEDKKMRLESLIDEDLENAWDLETEPNLEAKLIMRP